MEDCCAICAEPIEYVAFGACGHREVCSTCSARMRAVLGDTRCCICKQENACVFVTREQGTFTRTVDFTALSQGRLDFYRIKSLQAYFDTHEEYKRIAELCKLRCKICDSSSPNQPVDGFVKPHFTFKNVDLLRQHLLTVHKLSMCDLCMEGRKVFTAEQELYSKSQLQYHCSKGDADIGFYGHPPCQFCQKRFYGENELYHHMSTEHFTCHFCQRDKPDQFEYYMHYDDLEAHFRITHILCEHPECLSKKFIAFDDEREFQIHNAKEHRNILTRAERTAALKVPVSLRVGSNAAGLSLPPANQQLPPDGSAYPPLPGRPRRAKIRGRAVEEDTRPLQPPSQPPALQQGLPERHDPASSEDFPSCSGLTAEEIVPATKLLLKEIRVVLNGDDDKFAQFKAVHARFRNNELRCRDYCRLVSNLGLGSVISKLAWLCPDRQKREELLTACQNFAASDDDPRKKGKEPEATSEEGASSKGKGVLPSSSWTCPVCRLTNKSGTTCMTCSKKDKPKIPAKVVSLGSNSPGNPQTARGAWKNNGGLRLVERAKNESIIQSAYRKPGK